MSGQGPRTDTIATMRDALVIGGGIGGLACAWRLHRGGRDALTLCEASERPGGVIASPRVDGFLCEAGPDSLIRTKPAGLALIRELGLEDRLIATRPEARGALITRGRALEPVPEGLYLLAPGRWWPFVRSRLLSWPGKLRMAADLVLPRGPSDREESLAAFVRRRLGCEALERIAQPMVGGIYTADPRRLSLAATMPQFPEMEREHRSLLLAMRERVRAQRVAATSAGPRYSLFASLESGLEELVDALLARLDGVDLRIGTAVAGLRRENGVWIATTGNGEAIAARHVILALPAHRAAALLAAPLPALSRALAGIPYAGVATVNLAFRREQVGLLPEAAGFVVPAVEHRRVLACTFVSNKYAGRAPEGTVLLRAFVGGALHGEDLEADDDALVAGVLGELAWRLRIRGNSIFATVHRWPASMAQHVIGHPRRLAAIRAAEARIPGLHLVGNGYEGVGVPDVIAQADAAAAAILSR